METTVLNVTPLMARQWLETNTINRPLRKGVVEGYKTAFMRGEYRLTHQGIAFATTGELLDGQHRLSAIAEMPDDFTIPIMVTRGMPPESNKGIDQGLKRTHADVLAIEPGHAAVARYMATLVDTSRGGITSQYLIPYVRGTRAAYSELIGFCPRSAKAWSSACVRSAAILCLMSGGDADYIKVTYYALVHAEFDSMSPAAQTLFRQQVSGAANTKTYDMFCRAMKVFDAKKSQLDKIQISDPSSIISYARDLVTSKVLGKKLLASTKKAPAIAGAKRKTTARV